MTQPLRVAVVDDDEGIRRLVARVFAPPGCDTRSYKSGRDALNGIKASPVDVVICDLNMPGLQGDAFCRELKASLGALAPPVIILSCAGDEESVGACLDAGALHYVTKPFAPGHLRKLAEHAGRAVEPVRAPPGKREHLGPYRILGELGRGGMGIVYRGQREDTRQEVALKVRADGASLGNDTGRFMRELSLLAMLDHPGIARFIDSGTDDSLVYYAMELVPGTTLNDVLGARGALSWEEVAALGRDAAAALAYVHGRGVIHRDLKPANIILSVSGRARLIDFGLARRPNDPALTGKNEVVGTLHYIAPEAVESSLFSPASDVFSLGICLYEALRGKHPFDEPLGGHVFAVTKAYRDGELPLVEDAVPGVSPELAATIDRMLAPDPARRPTAAEVERALQGALSPGF
jgi:serine/threonine-protein kinase